jgi:hypothetical protein
VGQEKGEARESTTSLTRYGLDLTRSRMQLAQILSTSGHLDGEKLQLLVNGKILKHYYSDGN